MLVFFKLHPTVITEDNLHQSLLVSSMLESPINTLYQAVKQVFAPVLLKVSMSLCSWQFHSCLIKKAMEVITYCGRLLLTTHMTSKTNRYEATTWNYICTSRRTLFSLELFYFVFKDDHWSSAFDPKLASLLSELELGLGTVVRQSIAQPSTRKGRTEEDVLGMTDTLIMETISCM